MAPTDPLASSFAAMNIDSPNSVLLTTTLLNREITGHQVFQRTYEAPPTMEDQSVCAIRDSPVHGKGLVTVKELERGDVLVQEPALWVVTYETAMRSYPIKDTEAGMKNLIDDFMKTAPPNDDTDLQGKWLAKVLTLDGGLQPDEDLVPIQTGDTVPFAKLLERIILRNGRPERTQDAYPYNAIFHISSRVNHSCAPNAVQIVSKKDDNTVTSVIIASKKILKGEEIFINYVPEIGTSNYRRQYLKDCHEAEKCLCQVCTQSYDKLKKSNKRRVAIRDAVALCIKAGKESLKEDVSDAQKERLKLADKEALGEKGMGVIDKWLAQEGYHDYDIQEALIAASKSAGRFKKHQLEISLLDRVLEVFKTFQVGSPEIEKHCEDRRAEVVNELNIWAQIATGVAEGKLRILPKDE